MRENCKGDKFGIELGDSTQIFKTNEGRASLPLRLPRQRAETYLPILMAFLITRLDSVVGINVPTRIFSISAALN
jgi:hypothetical protein